MRGSTAGLEQPVSIAAFGAVGDGQRINTRAIQEAITSCPAGGTVVIPPGVFRCGAIRLKSDMTLWIEPGGVLLGSGDPADYPVIESRHQGLRERMHAALINGGGPGEPIRRVAIRGGGVIDGSGSELKRRVEAQGAAERGRVIMLVNAEHVELEGLTIRHSCCWCTHLIYCRDVSVTDVTFNTLLDGDGNQYPGIKNGDCLDLDSTVRVKVARCVFRPQDDGIAIKSGKNEEGRRVARPSEDITISDCRFESGFGLALGSEMSGGVRRVLVERCTFRHTGSLAMLKTARGRGSAIEDVEFRDCTYAEPCYTETEWFHGPISLDPYYAQVTPDADEVRPVDEGTPSMRRIAFRNIVIDNPLGRAIFLRGLPESPWRDLVFENVRARGETGLYGEHLRGVTLRNVTIEAAVGEPYVWKDAEGIVVEAGPGPAAPFPPRPGAPARAGWADLLEGAGAAWWEQVLTAGFRAGTAYAWVVRAHAALPHRTTYAHVTFENAAGVALAENEMWFGTTLPYDHRCSGRIPHGTARITFRTSGAPEQRLTIESARFLVESASAP